MISIRTKSRLTAPLGAVVITIVRHLRQLVEIRRQRRHLAGLSDGQLRDIGLTRADVVAETARPFWRA